MTAVVMEQQAAGALDAVKGVQVDGAGGALHAQSSGGAAAAAASAAETAASSFADGDEYEEEEEGEGEEMEEQEVSSSDDEEYNLRMFGINQALPVADGGGSDSGGAGDAGWDQGIPMTAEEYLRCVRQEAARCPQVVRVEPRAAPPHSSGSGDNSNSNPAKAPLPAQDQQQQWQRRQRYPVSAIAPLLQLSSGEHADAIPPPPEWAVPSQEWVQELVANFQHLRLQVQDMYSTGEHAAESLPHLNDEQGWQELCFGRRAQQQHQQAADQQHSQQPDQQPGPGPSSTGGSSDTAAAGAAAADECGDVTAMSPHVFATIMALDQVGIAELFVRHTEQLVEACPGALPLLRAQWLFALAARLEKPLNAEVGAAVRALLRHCARLRADLGGPRAPLLPALNVLIGIAGAYFGQDERLCRFVEGIGLA